VILLAEDNDNDVELMRIGFQRAKFAVNLHHVANGEQCMAFLRRQGQYADAPTPDLILLDLNMPRMDGREVLAEIVRDEALCKLPVVVLTTSDSNEDVLAAYKLRCSSYIVKPVDFDQFSQVVRGIGDYWFTLVVLPPKP
jgi:two-component system response regulator